MDEARFQPMRRLPCPLFYLIPRYPFTLSSYNVACLWMYKFLWSERFAWLPSIAIIRYTSPGPLLHFFFVSFILRLGPYQTAACKMHTRTRARLLRKLWRIGCPSDSRSSNTVDWIFQYATRYYLNVKNWYKLDKWLCKFDFTSRGLLENRATSRSTGLAVLHSNIEIEYTFFLPATRSHFPLAKYLTK